MELGVEVLLVGKVVVPHFMLDLLLGGVVDGLGVPHKIYHSIEYSR